jgi:hypothetical protein
LSRLSLGSLDSRASGLFGGRSGFNNFPHDFPRTLGVLWQNEQKMVLPLFIAAALDFVGVQAREQKISEMRVVPGPHFGRGVLWEEILGIKLRCG